MLGDALRHARHYLRFWHRVSRSKRNHSGQTILDDARAIVAYANVQGAVVPREYFSTLARFDGLKSGKVLNQADSRTLNEIISQCLKLISPSTIKDVHGYYSVRRGGHGVLAACVNALAIYLIVLVIGLTGSFNIANSALADLNKIDLSSYLDLLKETYDLSHNPSPDGTVTSKTKDNIKLLRKNDSTIITASASLGVLLPMVQQNSSPNWCMILVGTFNNCAANQHFDKESAKVVAADSGDGSPDPGQGSSSPSSADPVEIKNWNELRAVQSFGASIGLNLADVDTVKSLYLLEAQANHLIMVLGGSILPLLYGLLGASVFLMRQFFSQIPKDETVLISPGRTFLRLGLGAIAGLAIGWFWVPNAKSISEFTTTPFALAFLAGFSIELLFSILDRIIAAIGPGDAHASTSESTVTRT
jgi:hypothetical protein